METLKTQNNLPNINDNSLARSHTQICKQTIDNPRDDDLKRRQTLWSFQHKNRGVRAKFKDNDNFDSFSSDDGNESFSVSEEAKWKSSKRFNFPRIKAKVKQEINAPASVEESNGVKREYSSALRIGSNLYEQLRIKQKLDTKRPIPKQESLLKSLEKFPEISSSLSKLGYLKAAKNVVHYGGGFFGRNSYADKGYVEFRRSWTMFSPNETKNINNVQNMEKKSHHASMKQLNSEDTIKLKGLSLENTDTKPSEVLKISSSDLSQRLHEEKRIPELQRHKRKIEKENDVLSKRSKEDMIQKQMISEKYSVDFNKSNEQDDRKTDKSSVSDEISRRNEEWQKEIDLMVAKHETGSFKRYAIKPNTKTKETQTASIHFKDDRPKSDASLDMPEDQFGPSSYRPNDVNARLLNAAYCINPYKWTSRHSLTEGDRGWVEKAMEKTDLIDSTIYDVFAHKKQKSLVKTNENSVREKSSVSSKPP